LDTLKNLTILDLSNNRLSVVENLSACPLLQSVNLSHNALSGPEAVAHLALCPCLNNIDLTNNRLEPDEAFFHIFNSVPSLLTLSVNGNGKNNNK
jgi:Leucine-rich repeat (LRR) protein